MADNPGSIWTTDGACGDEQQDKNRYNLGDAVYVNGANFDEGTYDWSIVGQPGGASCDPEIEVAGGTAFAIGPSGNFCFEAYKVADGDCGVYKVDFGGKNDNYRVGNEVPEFGVVAASVAMIGALAGLVMFRRH